MPQVTVLRAISDERQVNRGHAVLALQNAGGVLVLVLLLLLLLSLPFPLCVFLGSGLVVCYFRLRAPIFR